jgi:hypothetical protein
MEGTKETGLTTNGTNGHEQKEHEVALKLSKKGSFLFV